MQYHTWGEPKKPRDWTDTLDTCTHVQDLANDSRRSTNKPECVRTPKEGCTTSNSPGTSPECAQRCHRGQGTTWMHRVHARARTATDLTWKRLQEHAKMSAYLRIKQNGPTHLMAQRLGAETKQMVGGNHADGSTVLADTQSVETDLKTAKITTRNIRTCQVGPRRQNLPYRLKIEMPKRPGQQNHVSIDGNNVHTPHNMPIEALGTWNRRIAFGRVLRCLWLLSSLKVLQVVVVSGALMVVRTYLGCSKLRKCLCFVVEHTGLGGFSNCFDYQSIGNQSSSKILSSLTTPSPPPTTTMMCRYLQVCTSPPSVLNVADHGSPSVDDVDHHHPQWHVLTIRYVTLPCTAYTNKGLWQPQNLWVCLCTRPLHQ